jgi:Ca2+:H+ antiporter
MPLRHALVPILSLLMLLGVSLTSYAIPLILNVGLLILAVFSAVHHAEVLAHRTGEPLGTLILALSVTVIEVALILSFMLAGGSEKSILARDTLFSAVMIICNGVIGLCFLVGGLRHREQTFKVDGVGPAMATLMALVTLTLVLPTFTTSSEGATYTTSQLLFVGISSLILWLSFIFFQTIRHRDYFLPTNSLADESTHVPPPSAKIALWSFLGLIICLISVVGLAKLLTPIIQAGVVAIGAPEIVVGIAIAMLVLLPETVAALRSAKANRLQTSLNLALGSALATIGLTIPSVIAASVLLELPLTLGLAAKDLVFLLLTFLVSSISFAHGRTSIMQGVVHLVIFLGFLFLALVP